MISVRRAIALVLGSISLLLAGVLYVTRLQSHTVELQAVAEARRNESRQLAEQMRESTSDLTMMVRLYVSTGEPRYREYFQQILDIRSGAAPRPENYDGSFWNRVLAQGNADVRYGERKSLAALMRDAKFIDAEFAALDASREVSDRLAEIENGVMAGLPPPPQGSADPDYAARAQPFYQRLVSPEYFDYKNRITVAIAHFEELVDRRTRDEVEGLREHSAALLRVQIILVALLLLVSLGAFLAASRGLVQPLQRLLGITRRIAAGEYAQRVQTLRSVSELQQLGSSFNDMAGAIEADIAKRQDAERRALDAQTEAERADRAKGAFLANMSHEIRTPLNAVIGLSELLRDTALDAGQRDSVEIIHGSGEHLLSVINDILDYTKVEAGMLELDEQVFDLRRTVEEAQELVAVKAGEKGLDLVCEFVPDTPEVIKGDRGRVRQILVNYLSNAIKFTERGDVSVLVSGAPLDAGRHCLKISVRDSGIGIPADRLDRLFKSFSQVDASTTRRYGGTGLGLAICKRLAECMGGEVGVESHPGWGSIFSFSFIAGSDPAWRPPPRTDMAVLAGKRLLIVDDNDTNRRIVRSTALEWGMRVVDTESPREALAMIERGDVFDLAALDFLMPEMDGGQLAAAIRRLRTSAQLRLLLLSSVRQTQRNLPDFDLVLLKPLRRAVLLEACFSLLAPVVETDAPPSSAVPLREAAPIASLRILLVEDNPVNQKVGLRMLESLGYAADVADDGLAAVQAVERKSYDLLLMDVQMPVMDGLEATRRIRRLPLLRQPRIFAMTASVLDSERQDCIDAGMERHLAKPIRRQELEMALREVVGALSKPPEAAAVMLVPAADPHVDQAVDEPCDEQVLARLVEEIGAEGAVEIIGALCDGAADAVKVLLDAGSADDRRRLRREAQTLKANCLMVGAGMLASAFGQLEARASDDDDATAAADLQTLAMRYGKLADALRRWSAAREGTGR